MGFGIFQIWPDVLMGIFGSSGDENSAALVSMGVTAMKIVSIHFPLAAIGIALGASFQGLGNGIYSSVTSLTRQLIVLVPAAYLLSLTGNIDAVWWSFPIAEVVSALLSIFFYLRIYRQRVKPLYDNP
jgi:Na+-driven multidrug efflux pump